MMNKIDKLQAYENSFCANLFNGATFMLEENNEIREFHILAFFHGTYPRAEWARGKKINVIGVDPNGNFYLRHADGSVRFWEHETQQEIILSKSVKLLIQSLSEPKWL